MNTKNKNKHNLLHSSLVVLSILCGFTLYLNLPRFDSQASETYYYLETADEMHDDTAQTMVYEDALRYSDLTKPDKFIDKAIFTADRQVEKYRNDLEIFLSVVISVVVSVILGFAISELRQNKPIQKRMDDDWQ